MSEKLSRLSKEDKKVITTIIILFAIQMILVGYTIGSAVIVICLDGTISAGYACIPAAFTAVASSVMNMYLSKQFWKKKDSNDAA